MKAAAGVNAHLNKVLGDQLIGINQYFLHARMFKNEGLDKLNERAYHQSIKKMKQADWLIERILLLEGLPNIQNLGSIKIGETCEERLQADLTFELTSVDLVKQAINHCEQVGDYISRALLVKIQTSAEAQIDWIESQQFLITQAGIANYLQAKM